MDTIYNDFGSAAIRAVKNITEFSSPEDAWKAACSYYYPDSPSSIKKSCPKGAFIGLCEAGLIKGIKEGSYFKSKKPNINKEYAITAVKLLRTTPTLSRKELWNKVKEKLSLGEKSHNSQMDVVLGLWDKKLIVEEK